MRALLIYIALYVLPAVVVYGQEKITYAPYYCAINRAELAIVELKFDRALHIYDSIFAIFPKHHRRNLHNAAICALLCAQPQRAQAWIMESIAQGASIKGFKASIFTQQPPEFWHPVERCHDSLTAVAQAEVERWASFKAKLDTMDAREQRGLFDENFIEKDYHILLYSHAQQLHRLLDSVGIPPIGIFGHGQQLPAGVMMHHFSLRNQLKNGMLDTSMAPYCDMDMRRYDLEQLLVEAVFNGDIAPDIAYQYTVHSDSVSIMGSRSMYQVNIDLNTKTIAIEPNRRFNIDKENARRSAFGMPTVEDALRKDLNVVIYYNQDCYPFDAHIQSDLALNFTQSAYDSLPQNEKNQLLLKRMEAYDKVKTEYMKSLSKRNLPTVENDSIKYNMLILKEFILPSGGYSVSETMLK